MFWNRISLYFSIFIAQYTFGQYCGVAVFKEVSNIPAFYQTISITNFNKEKCYTKYLHYKEAEKYLLKEDVLKIKELEEGEDIVMSKNPETGFIYSTIDESFFSDEGFCVKENAFSWKWELLEKTKKIGGFTCNSAKIKFRGRTFIAWYTMEIPIPFGPWKFKGLPGFILEVYEREKLWSIKAIKLNLKKEKCRFGSNDIEKTKKAISVDVFLKKMDSLYREKMLKADLRYLGRKPKISNMKEYYCHHCYDGSSLEIYEKKY